MKNTLQKSSASLLSYIIKFLAKYPCRFIAPNPTECSSSFAFFIDGTISMFVKSDTIVSESIAAFVASFILLFSITVAIFNEPKLHEIPRLIVSSS